MSLVAILDADKEGFLRSHVSLIQTIGRAARNLQGRVIMYSDTVTDSMRLALDETDRRRELQRKYNEEHGITPRAVKKNILDMSAFLYDAAPADMKLAAEKGVELLTKDEVKHLIGEYTAKMEEAAEEMEFEQAAAWRDKLLLLKEMDLGLKPPARSLLSAAPKREDKPRSRKGPAARYRARK